MSRKQITRSALDMIISDTFRKTSGNIITAETASRPDLDGLVIFDAPIFRVGSADDPLFEELKRDGVVGPWYNVPQDWLEGARSVVSIFLPFTQRVRGSNRGNPDEISREWLHGRIEGQAFINAFMAKLSNAFHIFGAETAVPASDPRLKTAEGGVGTLAGTEGVGEDTYGSNWSERHTAYICGLGTFALSKGLITELGIAGRFASLITDAEIAPDVREYTGIYDWCTRCGACVARCPVGAITLEGGKDHRKCGEFQKISKKRYVPRYGCGKCQTGVPCEGRRPGKG